MALVQGIDTDVVIGVTDTLTERSSIIRDEAVMWQPLLRSAVIKEHDYSVSVVPLFLYGGRRIGWPVVTGDSHHGGLIARLGRYNLGDWGLSKTRVTAHISTPSHCDDVVLL